VNHLPKLSAINRPRHTAVKPQVPVLLAAKNLPAANNCKKPIPAASAQTHPTESQKPDKLLTFEHLPLPTTEHNKLSPYNPLKSINPNTTINHHLNLPPASCEWVDLGLLEL